MKAKYTDIPSKEFIISFMQALKHVRRTTVSSPKISLKSSFYSSSLLVGLVIASFVTAGLLDMLDVKAVRLLVVLFASQWLHSAIQFARGKSSLFSERAFLALCAVGNLVRAALKSVGTRRLIPIELRSEESVSLLFWVIKLIFIPFLVSVAVRQADHLVPFLLSGRLPELLFSFSMFYIIWLVFLDLLDTVVATLGYAVESKKLDNQVRSVDTSIIAWLSVLLCYPPLLSFSNIFIPLSGSPFSINSQGSLYETTTMVLIAIFLTLFTISTLNMNVHFSNLCHRGLVTGGLYSVVRHPAYASKLITWALVLAYLSPFNLLMWSHFAFWIAIYITRAITEERHLSRVDERYVEYCRRVKYRFIPGIV